MIPYLHDCLCHFDSDNCCLSKVWKHLPFASWRRPLCRSTPSRETSIARLLLFAVHRHVRLMLSILSVLFILTPSNIITFEMGDFYGMGKIRYPSLYNGVTFQGNMPYFEDDTWPNENASIRYSRLSLYLWCLKALYSSDIRNTYYFARKSKRCEVLNPHLFSDCNEQSYKALHGGKR